VASVLLATLLLGLSYNTALLIFIVGNFCFLRVFLRTRNYNQVGLNIVLLVANFFNLLKVVI
jgi:hypothetical protein